MTRKLTIIEPDLLSYRGHEVELAFNLNSFWPDILWSFNRPFDAEDPGHLFISTTDPHRPDAIRLVRAEKHDIYEIPGHNYRTTHSSGYRPWMCDKKLRSLFGRLPHHFYAWRDR